MSTNNNPDKENDHKYRYYRLQVLNAGTFRIINENGEEMWNMWSHAPYHEFNVYYEEEFYDSCKSTARNPNLPVITTIDEKSSIIRVGEQLVNRFNKEQFIEYKKKSIIESRKFEKAIKNKNSETSDSGKKKNPFEIEGNNNADLKDGEIFNNNSYLFNNDDLNTDSPTAFLIDDLLIMIVLVIILLVIILLVIILLEIILLKMILLIIILLMMIQLMMNLLMMILLMMIL